MPSSETSEIHVGLTGPVRSGKTNLFVDFAKCVELNFHGFRQLHDIKIETDRINRRLLRSYYRNLPEATESVTDIRFDLEVDLPAPEGAAPGNGLQNRQFTIHVRDAPGEAAFPNTELSGTANPHVEKTRELDEWFSKAKGIVLVISVLNAGTDAGFEALIDKVEDFFERAGKPEFQNLERVAIAISMFDLLLLRFGNRSRDIATEPEAVLAILHAHMRPAFDMIKDFRPFPSQERDIDLRFIATSSYGFHPQLGCANIDATAEILDPGNSRFPVPLTPDNVRYPYMTADPFIFAALGLDSPFLFTRDEILSGILKERSLAETTDAVASSMAAPVETANRNPG
ncbi:hypothetical protein PZ897_19290 [Hoeflea sp. YIM 152468]|uniref:hypothetical protein n=1 Tax=Hoeflea sp. YIM 152468 TaxID=3031759 RepID=UPI0023DCAAE4|nr:hypothetical protein [Hoeflea sp. YIM 152468]MDF1610331.1 hypothetical protein [Hoeflea sp. YIM 152468]